jgi:hypothetical protein
MHVSITRTTTATGWCLALLLATVGTAQSAEPEEAASPLAAWQAGVKVKAVCGEAESHSIHSYFNTSPESPEGKYVLFFRSGQPEAQLGEVCIYNRKTGEVRVLAEKVETEDAHRVACQQWTAKGETVVYHAAQQTYRSLSDILGGKPASKNEMHWQIFAVDVASGKARNLATDRQLCWGNPAGMVVPVYGMHWQSEKHPDLELLHVNTGQAKLQLTCFKVREDNSDWFSDTFGSKPTSIFFPILSPDATRVLFKIASPAGGGFRDPNGSQREGLFCYDLTTGKMLCRQASWGHPAWHPDSKQVINVRRRQLVVMDSTTGVERPIEGSPLVPGSHPAFSPDGKLYVSDWRVDSSDVPAGTWRVIVGDVQTGEHVVLHQFIGTEGATSWRGSHPHPVFSPDGKRVYFNVSEGRWTRLFVAEASE